MPRPLLRAAENRQSSVRRCSRICRLTSDQGQRYRPPIVVSRGVGHGPKPRVLARSARPTDDLGVTDGVRPRCPCRWRGSGAPPGSRGVRGPDPSGLVPGRERVTAVRRPFLHAGVRRAATSSSAMESMICGGRPPLAQAAHKVKHSVAFNTPCVMTRRDQPNGRVRGERGEQNEPLLSSGEVARPHRRRPSHDIGVGSWRLVPPSRRSCGSSSSSPSPTASRSRPWLAGVMRAGACGNSSMASPSASSACKVRAQRNGSATTARIAHRRQASRIAASTSAIGTRTCTARCGAGDDRRLPRCCDVEVRRLLHRAHHQRMVSC